jgi:NADPH2:quinone reductase
VPPGERSNTAPPLTFSLRKAAEFQFRSLRRTTHHTTRLLSSAGEAVLISGGGGGVGVAAIQLAKLAGARVTTTCGSSEKCDAVLLQLLFCPDERHLPSWV